MRNPTGSARPVAGLNLQKCDAFTHEKVQSATPKRILARMLSLKAYITPATLPTCQTTGGDCLSREELGKGQCGTVYTLPPSPIVPGPLEVGKVPNSPEKVGELLNEFEMHRRAAAALSNAPSTVRDVRIPELRRMDEPDRRLLRRANPLKDIGAMFTTHYEDNYRLVSRQVCPVPQIVREAIVDVLCPPAIQQDRQGFLNRDDNRNCLLRVYLGRRATNRTRRASSVGLRNFPLHVNEMEELKLDTAVYARMMAQTLAVLHWGAGIDANDVEFVLGGSLEATTDTGSLAISDRRTWAFAHGVGREVTNRSVRVSMWLMDFNQCAAFEDDDDGLRQIVHAFFQNDPYYPRPHSANSKGDELWAVFRTRYLEVSAMFTASSTPRRFVGRIEEQTRKRTVGELFSLG